MTDEEKKRTGSKRSRPASGGEASNVSGTSAVAVGVAVAVGGYLYLNSQHPSLAGLGQVVPTQGAAGVVFAVLCAQIPLGLALYWRSKKSSAASSLSATRSHRQIHRNPGEALLHAALLGDASACATLIGEAQARREPKEAWNIAELLSYKGSPTTALGAGGAAAAGAGGATGIGATQDDLDPSLGWTALHVAAAHGQTAALKVLLDAVQCSLRQELVGVLEAKDANGCTPLVLAVCAPSESAALALIASGAEAGAMGPRSRNVLQLACMTGRMPKVVEALKNALPSTAFQALAKASDVAGYHALHLASMAGEVNVVEMLLDADDAGSKAIDSVALDGTTALHAAVRLGRVSLVQLLLERGANPAIACRFGNTPLHLACMHAQPAMVRLLLQRSASLSSSSSSSSGKANIDFFTQDNDGLYPLHTACQALALQSKEPQSTKKSSTSTAVAAPPPIEDRLVECVHALVEAGHPLDVGDYGNSNVIYLLAWGATEVQLRMIKFLLEDTLEKANRASEISVLLHAEAESNWTCLHVAHNIPGPCAAETLRYLQTMASKHCPDLLSLDLSTPRDTSNALYHLRKGEHNRIPMHRRQAVLKGDYSVQGLASFLQSFAAAGQHKPRVVVVCGAGISTNAGIKDFRSSTGLYADKGMANVFSASFLRQHPEEFYALIRKEFLPFVAPTGTTVDAAPAAEAVLAHAQAAPQPTACHALMRLLRDHGWLTRVYTQNIDMLEFKAGLRAEEVVECHGSFRQAWCMGCGRVVPSEEMKAFWASVSAGNVPCCYACGGVLRPDVTFFGEPLPPLFHDLVARDVPQCDLLLVMGTSLVVYPVAALPSQVGPLCVRALFNREPSGCFQYVPPSPIVVAGDGGGGAAAATAGVGTGAGGAATEGDAAGSPTQGEADAGRASGQYRDVFVPGDCDGAARALAAALGWGEEMAALVAAGTTQ